jgi:hypothetical protein
MTRMKKEDLGGRQKVKGGRSMAEGEWQKSEDIEEGRWDREEY